MSAARLHARRKVFPPRRGPEGILAAAAGILVPASWAVAFMLGAGETAGAEEWNQWGGEGRDFIVRDVHVAPSWPAGGPPLLWSRPLGGGYSGVVADDTFAFTMYHEGEEDVVICVERAGGKDVWERRYLEPFKGEGHGPGPHATPAIAGERMFSLSAGGKLHCLDKRTGRILWMRDFVAEFEAETPWHGFAASPLPYEDMLILPVGGTDGRGVIAFDQATGRIVWQNLAIVIGYSSPVVIEVDGRPQLVLFTKYETLGLDPCTGGKLWELPHRNPPQHNATLAPLWGPDHVLWTSVRTMGEGDGSRALRLTRAADGTHVEEVYYNPRSGVEPYANAVRAEGVIYTSLGSGRRARFVAIDAGSGEVLWEKTGVGTVNSLMAGEHLIVLGEQGRLLLCRPDRTAPNVVADATIQTERSWTAPSLAGTQLFIRDNERMWCFELAGPAPPVEIMPATNGWTWLFVAAGLLAAGLLYAMGKRRQRAG